MWGEPEIGAESSQTTTFDLPAGTVTFLLADIEARPGAHDAGGGMAESLDSAITRNGGVLEEIHSPEEGSVAAFSRASDAVAAALEVQLTLPGGPLRIALQTAEAQLHEQVGYFGHALTRGAHLRAAAHAGQILVSGTTRELADHLPEGVGFDDLGTHRLRDLGRPEHIYSLTYPGLRSDFPQPRTLDAVPNNLPGELTSFVGRRRELEQIRRLLAGVRLLTLTGTGGCGKTRLALQSAAAATDRYPDGVWLVELAALTDPALLPAAAVAAIGIEELAGWSVLQRLIEHLRNRTALLVLDNCEHMLGASAELADELLRSCPLLTVLGTSRAPLGVPGETTWRVPSMSFPDLPAREPIEVLKQSDAVRLFIDRAMQVRPEFQVTADNAPAIAQLCHDVDGIPLAIELAAARVRMLAPEQIAGALGGRFQLLTGGSRTAVSRHRTLEASIDWSYLLLSERERSLFRRLSVFAGGWTLEAAVEVCTTDGSEGGEVIDDLTLLVDQSMVTATEHGSHMRYGMLQSVKQYADARLRDAGELETAGARHLSYFLALAEGAGPALIKAGRHDRVVRMLADETPNLRAALEWAIATRPTDSLRLADALHLFWLFMGRYQEGDSACARALDATGDMQTVLRGRVFATRAQLGLYGGLYAEAPLWAQSAHEIGLACADLGLQARAKGILGTVFGAIHPAAGLPVLQESMDLAVKAGDPRCWIDSAQFLAWCLIFQDEFEEAEEVLEDNRAAVEALGYRWGRAMHCLALCRIAKIQGRLDEAIRLTEEMAAASVEIGDPVTRSMAANALTWISVERGEAEMMKASTAGMLEEVVEAQAGMAVGFAHQAIARVKMALGDMTGARRHLEQAIEADRLRLAYFLPEHLSILGSVERILGNSTKAQQRGEEALQIAVRVGSGWMQSYAERLLSRLALESGDLDKAENYAQSALDHLHRRGLELYIPECLEILAAVASGLESYEESARLLGAASAARMRMGTERFPPEVDFWAGIENAGRQALLPEAWDSAFEAGVALKTEEAVAYARRARGQRKRPSHGWASLTPTELELVQHVAAGLTNRQIGNRMFIAAGTVKTHIAHIFVKLDMASRAQLAAEAAKRSLDQGAGSSRAGTA